MMCIFELCTRLSAYQKRQIRYGTRTIALVHSRVEGGRRGVICDQSTSILIKNEGKAENVALALAPVSNAYFTVEVAQRQRRITNVAR